ncbi:MAG: hypothetical protein LUG44_07380 [Clostridiales bacterium]|nr:hypothetical protein [Clostridiales bacterium]
MGDELDVLHDGGSFLFFEVWGHYTPLQTALKRGYFHKRNNEPHPAAAVGFLLRFVKLCGILTVALSNTAAVGTSHGGQLLCPPVLEKGGLPNEYDGSFHALPRHHRHLQPVHTVAEQKEVTARFPKLGGYLL